MTTAKLWKSGALTAVGVLGLVAMAVVAGSNANAENRCPASRPGSSSGDRVARLRRLSPMRFHVTQENGTEPPFRNAYWNNHHDGIYVDIVSGEPLFSSKDKYDSGTGWPSFTGPIEAGHLVTKTDRSLFETRIEVRSAKADSHLGHVFDDGPPPTGKRYCMNSAAMRFIPVEEMTAAGYARYLPQVERKP